MNESCIIWKEMKLKLMYLNKVLLEMTHKYSYYQ